jgi:hypothetical protein
VSALAKSAKVCEVFYLVCTSMYRVSLSKVCDTLDVFASR